MRRRSASIYRQLFQVNTHQVTATKQGSFLERLESVPLSEARPATNHLFTTHEQTVGQDR
jgi:hypothetical protein